MTESTKLPALQPVSLYAFVSRHLLSRTAFIMCHRTTKVYWCRHSKSKLSDPRYCPDARRQNRRGVDGRLLNCRDRSRNTTVVSDLTRTCGLKQCRLEFKVSCRGGWICCRCESRGNRGWNCSAVGCDHPVCTRCWPRVS